MSDKMKLKGLLSRNQVASEHGGRVYLLVQVTAPDRPAARQGGTAGAASGGGAGSGPGSGKRLPLNLAAVLDRSGSMQGAKLAYTQKAMSFLVDQVDKKDVLALVAYDDQVEVVQRAARVRNKDLLKGQVQALRAGGMTNLSGGLTAGAREARRNAGKGLVNRVLLMTDGLANQGVTSSEGLVAMAARLRDEGVLLTTLGVGDTFDEDLLTAMAEAGGGNFYYIENPDRIPAIFSQELQGLLAVAGQSLALRVRSSQGVRIEGVLGYPPTWGPGSVELDLPDIYAGETKSLVLELSVAPGSPGRVSLADVELVYEDALNGSGEVRLSLDLPFERVPLEALPDEPENPEVMREASLAWSSLAVDEAIREADARHYERSSQVLEETIAALSPMADDEAVAGQIEMLRERVEELRSGQYEASSRKHLRAMSHQNRSGRRHQ